MAVATVDGQLSSSRATTDTLHSSNVYYESIIGLFDSSIYITTSTTVDNAFDLKYKKGGSKDGKDEGRRANKLRKREKYSEEGLREGTVGKKRKAEKEAEEAESDAESDNDESELSYNSTTAKQNPPPAPKIVTPDIDSPPPTDDTNLSKLSKIELLRQKLQSKIAAKQAQRGGNNEDKNSSATSKRAARRKRKEELKKHHAKKEKKKGFTATATSKPNDVVAISPSGSSNATTPVPTPTVTDDLTSIDFGGITGLVKKKNHGNNKSLNGIGKKKSLDRLLAEASAKKMRLKELKSSDKASDVEKAKSIEWGDTLRTASGEKGADTVEGIKKQMKRKEKKKEKSAKAWKDRIETVAGKMMEKQDIRKHNLNERKKGGKTAANLSAKRIVSEENADGEGEDGKKKKRKREGPYANVGRKDEEADGKMSKGRAGFEGKKGNFINNGKKQKQ